MYTRFKMPDALKTSTYATFTQPFDPDDDGMLIKAWEGVQTKDIEKRLQTENLERVKYALQRILEIRARHTS